MIMKTRKGFTLIELMIVVAIIGILSAIAIPKFADLIRKSNEGATRGNLSTIRSAVSIYYSENEGVYPASNVPGASASLTTALTAPPVGGTGGKYLKEVPAVRIPPNTGDATVTHMTGDAATPTVPAFPATANWGYNQWQRAVTVNVDVTSTTRTQGEVWVHTSNTDSRGTVWFTY